MSMDTCAATSCGNLATSRFTSVTHTVCVCDRHAREIEDVQRPDGYVHFAALPPWAQPAEEEAA
jgi:hypothetical protein